MCTKTRTLLFAVGLIAGLNLAKAAPSPKTPNRSVDFDEKNPDSEVERSLEQFLNLYYDEYLSNKETRHAKAKAKPENKPEPEDDIYETMQGDQPVIENNINQNLNNMIANSTNVYLNARYQNNFTYMEAVRNRSRDNFIQFLKKNILQQVGRINMTMSKHDDPTFNQLNMSEIIPEYLNSTRLLNADDQITEKIRSFYPSCEVPVNTDEDLWKDDDIMNLFFNFDYISNDRNANIATATLRLYRLTENSTILESETADCDNTEDEKLLRVSIYWYTKSLKKRRVKRRLSDSKVIPVHSKWVELSVKPATKAWARGRNLGLGVHVEDQEGNTLRADRYFKGASCMVGTSTPKPIPTIIIDAARKSNGHRLDGAFKGNSSALYTDLHLLPTIDICTLEFPENYTQQAHLTSLRINACNLRKMHELSQQMEEKERLERIFILPEYLASSSTRHIRHQRQHLANKMNENAREFDTRSRITGSRPLTNEEWSNLVNNKLNFSTVNR